MDLYDMLKNNNAVISKIELLSSSDSCSDKDYTNMSIEFLNGGNGYFIRINTEEFAFDTEDLTKLLELCSHICSHNDIVEDKARS